MELKVNAVAIPEAITFNYKELKEELLQKVSVYESMVYTADQVQAAKKDRASLNGLKKALNDERIRQEREFNRPFQQFKAQISELCNIIDKASFVVDSQVKAFEEQQKQDKLEKIRAFFERVNLHAIVKFEQILDPKWLNASVSMKSIEDAIIAKGNQITNDIAVVRGLPSFAFEAEQTYLQTLDLAKAVSEAHRLQEQAEKKAAWEAEQAMKKEETEIKPEIMSEPVPGAENVPSRQWIGFQAFLSVDEAKALGQFLKSNGIKYKKI